MCFLFILRQLPFSSCRLWLSATSYLARFAHGGAQWAQIAMGERPGALSDKQFLASDEVWGFFHIQSTLTYCLDISANVQHRIWLARSQARPVSDAAWRNVPGRFAQSRTPSMRSPNSSHIGSLVLISSSSVFSLPASAHTNHTHLLTQSLFPLTIYLFLTILSLITISVIVSGS